MAAPFEESVLGEELEVLESIYIHELSVDRDVRGHATLISLDLHPATGDDLEKQYVCMTLNIIPGCKYPDVPPEVEIRNPRGIAEEEIKRVTESMHQLAIDRTGGPMLYELTELAKECLTEGNIPHGPCTICLELFTEGEPFTRTDCYHYYHQYCLARYIRYTLSAEQEQDAGPAGGEDRDDKEEGVVCPVCRLPISYDLDSLSQAPEPRAAHRPDPVTPQVRAAQRRMAKMFDRQKAKGGIIDLEAERNKYLVPANLVISLDKSPEDSSDTDHTDTTRGSERAERIDTGHRRGHSQRSGGGAGRHGYPHRDHHNRQYRPHPRDRRQHNRDRHNQEHRDRHNQDHGHRDRHNQEHRDRHNQDHGHMDRHNQEHRHLDRHNQEHRHMDRHNQEHGHRDRHNQEHRDRHNQEHEHRDRHNQEHGHRDRHNQEHEQSNRHNQEHRYRRGRTGPDQWNLEGTGQENPGKSSAHRHEKMAPRNQRDIRHTQPDKAGGYSGRKYEGSGKSEEEGSGCIPDKHKHELVDTEEDIQKNCEKGNNSVCDRDFQNTDRDSSTTGKSESASTSPRVDSGQKLHEGRNTPESEQVETRESDHRNWKSKHSNTGQDCQTENLENGVKEDEVDSENEVHSFSSKLVKGGENFGQHSENHGQRPEKPRQRSEKHGQHSEKHEQHPEKPRQHSEKHGQCSENREQRSENHGQRSENHGQRSENHGQRSENHGQHSENNGQCSENHGQRSEKFYSDGVYKPRFGSGNRYRGYRGHRGRGNHGHSRYREDSRVYNGGDDVTKDRGRRVESPRPRHRGGRVSARGHGQRHNDTTDPVSKAQRPQAQ